MSYIGAEPVPVVAGGTGRATLTNHSVLVGSAVSPIAQVGPGTALQVLQSGGAGSDPAYSTATYPATTTINQVLYSSATNTVAGITAANNGTLISGTTGVPSWLANGTTGQLLTATTGSPPSWTTVSSGNVSGPGSSTDRAIATWNGTGGTALFDNSTVKISSAGMMTNTTQPSFYVYSSTSPANVTGNGATYKVPLNTAVFDNDTNFDTTNNQFVAPVTGRYQFNLTFSIIGVGVAHTTIICQLVTTLNSYILVYGNPFLMSASNTIFTQTGSCIVPMTATNTAFLQINVFNGALTVGLNGGLGNTAMSGFLVC